MERGETSEERSPTGQGDLEEKSPTIDSIGFLVRREWNCGHFAGTANTTRPEKCFKTENHCSRGERLSAKPLPRELGSSPSETSKGSFLT